MRVTHLLFPSLLGFISGLPLMLVGSTLQAWGTEAGLNIMALGFLTLIGLPYAYKFLWAPLLDRWTIPFFKGQRRGWILTMMLLLVISLTALAFSQPQFSLLWFVLWALATALFSATLDTSVDAFRIEFLPEEEYGIGNAGYVSAYRVSMLVSGGLALIIADHYGWRNTYLFIAGLIFLGFILFLFSHESPPKAVAPKFVNWRQSLWDPLKDLFQRKNILWIIVFIILYKFGEALGTALTSAFLLRELHFSLTVVGGVYKTVGLVATIIGAFIGGLLYRRYSLFTTLFSFGVLQALGILFYVWLAREGQNYSLMMTAVGVEALTAGMATTVFLAFMMRLCNPIYPATHFALLSACASIGRIFTGPLASVMVKHFAWSGYFLGSFFICIPALLLLWFIRPHLMEALRI